MRPAALGVFLFGAGLCPVPVGAASIFVAPPAAPAFAVAIPPRQVLQLGRRIWRNECRGTYSGLTSWNRGEEFASLGIGHFIWYPEGRQGPFRESFPMLLSYLRRHGARTWPER